MTGLVAPTGVSLSTPARGSLLPAVGLAVTVCGALVCAWALVALPEDQRATLNDPVAAALMFVGTTGLAGVGWALSRQGSSPRMAALMIGTGLAWVLSFVPLAPAIWLQESEVPGAALAQWLTNWAWVPAQTLSMVLLLRFPTGDLPSPAWRWVERAVWSWAVATTVVTALAPGPLAAEALAPATNPLGLPALAGVIDSALTVLFTVMPVLVLVVASAPVLRWGRATGQERRQLLWVGVAALLLALSAPLAVVSERGDLVQGLAMFLLPAAIAAAMVREQLWDVDVRRRFDRLTAVRAEERDRLRRDLHDSLGPLLGAISMRAEAARNLLANGGAERTREVDDVLATIDHDSRGALAEVRRMIEELGPSLLQGQDLVAALRAHLDSWRPGFHAELVVGTPPADLPTRVEEAAFLVVAEAVRNAARHAGVDGCAVRVSQEGGRLQVRVSDTGCGLRGRPAGVGRDAMARRAAAVGGAVGVHDRPEGGVSVSLELPVEPT